MCITSSLTGIIGKSWNILNVVIDGTLRPKTGYMSDLFLDKRITSSRTTRTLEGK